MSSFMYDLFVSYAHTDNESDSVNSTRWISDFCASLKTSYHKITGGSLNIWRDPLLHPGDLVERQILEAGIQSSAIFIPIISPSYINSPNCRWEFIKFIKIAQVTPPGLTIHNKHRIIPIVKYPFEDTKLDSSIGKDEVETIHNTINPILRHQFYKLIPEKSRPIEISAKYLKRQYQELIDSLAYAIKEMLYLMNNDISVSQETEEQTRSIFLAITAQAARNERDIILKGLKAHKKYNNLNIRILPDDLIDIRELQLKGSEEFKGLIKQYLNMSSLSIHLTNETYGAIPEGSEKSFVELQYELVLEHSRKSENTDFTFLIRKLPSQIPLTNGKQAEFFERIDKDAKHLQEVELHSHSNLQEFMSYILEKIAKPKRIVNPNEDSLKYVYFIYDQNDRNNERMQEVSEHFSELYELIHPVFTDAIEENVVVSYHQDQLCNCNGVIIYHGNSSDSWCHAMMWEVKKAKLQRKERNLSAKTILLDEPKEKKALYSFRSKEFLILQTWEESWKKEMEDYLKTRV